MFSLSLSRRQFTAALLLGTAAPAIAALDRGATRPNIITIVLDDVGFSDLGCFGAEIATPAIDRLAAAGLRFNRFDSKAVCSATRAAILTGRNGHTVNFPDVPDTAYGDFAVHYAPQTYHLPQAAQTSAQVLQDGGYATWLLGKWHLIPLTELAPGTSRQNWPLQRGFDYFYGFARGWTDQYNPDLVEGNDYIDPDLPADYHLSEDLIDRAIGLIEGHRQGSDSTNPFFLHLGLGVAHSPIQAPPEYSARYAGKYDSGWDAVRAQRFARMKELGIIPADCLLPPRTPDDRAWTDLSEDEKVVFARYMEVYAGFIEHADAQIGRLLDCLTRTGLEANTLVVLLSDNGAASEAGQAGFFDGLYRPNPLPPAEQRARLPEMGTIATQAEYPRPWAVAGSAPFRRYKLWPFLGGVRTPLIVSWPAMVADGGAIRSTYIDAVDIAPTLLHAAGLSFPATVAGELQIPVAGRSFLDALGNPAANGRQRQYFELRGHRAITDGSWRAVAIHDCANDYAEDSWQLFDLATDFTEATDLSAGNPRQVQRMKRLWDEEWQRWVGQPLTQPAPNICQLNSEYNLPTMTRPDR
jgi:arylsulfatase A-like enzyme